MESESKFDEYREILNRFREESRFRTIPIDRTDSARIDLSGNDYLGLGLRWRDYLSDFFPAPFSASASRLLAARQDDFKILEQRLEDLYHKPAIIFNSGYHANVGCVTALNVPDTVFLVDRLIHASVIDGLSMGRVDYRRFRHNDMDQLEKMIIQCHDKVGRIIVITESIYSMDGDGPDLHRLADLKRMYPKVILYIDEAHAFGVYGRLGLGRSEAEGLLQEFDIIIGTFGKAGASVGAFAMTSRLLKDFLINNARSFIFSTALPPVNIRWTLKMIDLIVGMEKERKYLSAISEEFRKFISEITGKPNPSISQIVPWITGDAAKAVRLATLMRDNGIDVLPIRRPTVPPRSERLRFSLHAGLTAGDMKRIKTIISNLI